MSKNTFSQNAKAYRLIEQGRQQFETAQFEAAKQSFQQALIIYREINDCQGEGKSLLALGAVYLDIKDLVQAIEIFREGLTIAKDIKDCQMEEFARQGLSLAQNNLRKTEADQLCEQGNQQYFTSQFPAALQSFQKALEIYREIGDRCGEGTTLNGLGLIYNDLGDYAKAIDYYQQALDIAHKIGFLQGEAAVLGNLGKTYIFLGDYTKAIEYVEPQWEIVQKIKNRIGESHALGHLGLAYYFLGDYAKAINYHQKSLAIKQEIKDRHGEGKSLGILGAVYYSLGDYTKAIDYQQQHLAIARNIKDRLSEGKALTNLGLNYISLGDYIKGIEYQKQSLPIALEIGDKEGEGAALHNLGLAFQRSGNLVEAETTLICGIEAYESIRERLGGNDAYKVSVFEQQARTYRLLQEVLIAQNKPIAALEIAERGRARAFVELLARCNATIPSSAKSIITPPQIQQLQQIAQQQNATLVEYSIIYGDFKISELYIWAIASTGDVEFRQVDLKSLNTPLEKLLSDSHELILGRSRGNNNQILLTPGDRVRLKDDPLSDELWVVVTVDESTQTVALKKPSFPEGLTIQSPITDVAEVDPKVINSRLQQLHQILIEPIVDLLPTDPNAHVIFIPQGNLFQVPFPALQDAAGKYLIEKHTILTAPAIQVLDLTHQRRAQVPGAAKEVLVVGNPTMPKLPGASHPLAPLPNSEREAQKIAQLFLTQPLIGNQATKAAIMRKLPEAKLIHLATHGLLNEQQALKSAIALAPSGDDNGLLTAEEILDLRLSAELVVLSACNTGQGKITGDGVIGLSRSLISAGVPSVIVSLWSVPDAPTAILMTNFYQNLQKNPNKAQALRIAMLSTLKEYPNPKDWAAFILIGESN